MESGKTLLLAGFADLLFFLAFLALVTVLAAEPSFFSAKLDSLVQKCAFFFLLSIIRNCLGLSTVFADKVLILIIANPASYWFVAVHGQAFPSSLMVFGVLFHYAVILKIIDPMRPLLVTVIVFTCRIAALALSIDNKYSNLLQNAAGVVLTLGAILGPGPLFWKQALRKLG